MSSTPAPLGDALAKKGGLTLSQLVDYDDRCTDAMVDRLYYWTTIRKLRPGYHAARGVREEDIARIVQEEVVLRKDAAKATQRLLEQSAIKRYHQGLKTKDEKEHFSRHLRKYVNIYLPDCPFEVCTTNRYTILTQEASAVARREIKKGEVVKYLSGIQVAMTKQEEAELDVKKRDFSIVMSSRKKTPALFLGPARFANHDCDANAKLSTTGSHGMQITTVRNIDIGEEITVSYGNDYFGEDNCECLCATCERFVRNGWGRQIKEESTPEQTPEPELEVQNKTMSLRRKRKYRFDSETHSPIATPESESSAPAKRAKTTHIVQSLAISQILSPKNKSPHSPSRLSQVVKAEDSESDVSGFNVLPTQPRKLKYRYGKLSRGANATPDTETGRSSSPISSVLDGSQESSASTEATSVDDVPESKSHDRSDSELSELSESYELDDERQMVVRSRKRKRPSVATRQSLRNRPYMPVPTIETTYSMDDDDEDDTRRRPGDYTLTPKLLASVYSRWVECRNCDEHFVQEDAYLTRANCPRCERHSKIYGYAWPKTDKESRNDTEERVLDHRTINRFIDPEAERRTKKGRKTLDSLVLERERSLRESEQAEWPRRSRRGTS